MDSPQGSVIFDAGQMAGLLGQMASQVVQRHPGPDLPVLVGIRSGGAHLAWRLQKELARLAGQNPPTGIIDITLYRDDWTLLHSRPKVGRTEIDFSLEERQVILVDDVLYTGRTVRAAMDALIDLGRPGRIELAVLIDRGLRELPIQPDYVGASLETGPLDVIDVLLTEKGAPEDQVVRRARG